MKNVEIRISPQEYICVAVALTDNRFSLNPGAAGRESVEISACVVLCGGARAAVRASGGGPASPAWSSLAVPHSGPAGRAVHSSAQPGTAPVWPAGGLSQSEDSPARPANQRGPHSAGHAGK